MISDQSAEDVQIQRTLLKFTVSTITGDIFVFIINNPYSVSETLFKLADMAMYVRGDEHDKLVGKILNDIIVNPDSVPNNILNLAFQLADARDRLRKHDEKIESDLNSRCLNGWEEGWKQYDPS